LGLIHAYDFRQGWSFPLSSQTMRRHALAAAIALSLSTSSAFALVTEPNGLVVPLDSMNGEVQLYTMFASRGEPIDWQADGLTAPSVFSPLCDFTAEFILNEAGSHFGLAWYNSTGTAPQPSDLHVIMPANTPVGTVVTSTDIKNDPSYLGGLIGFALVGGQTHYSDPQWNPVCTGCTPAAPWVAAVIYPSQITPNAFYIAFEDGQMGANPGNFANDGDFNDDVFFLTGLTCAGGGQPCDTGQPGICAQGLTECSGAGVTCVQLVGADPSETCNGLDDDCNGVVDEGDICPAGFICDKGTCVEECGSGEFVCDSAFVCKDGYCVDPSCAEVTCDAGEVCVRGICKAPCDDVICPYPTVCRVGKCVDPCDGVTCGAGYVCEQGVCITACSCAPCSSSLACDEGTGHCVDPSCVGMTCDDGTHCVDGSCVDNCDGAVCPSGQACQDGACVDSSGSGGGGGSTGAFASGAGGSDGPGGTSGTQGGGAQGGSGAGGDQASSGEAGGCGCRTAGDDRGGGMILGFGLALASLSFGRRRRRAG
jgi:MYXO-CTERM domain-containing protein